MNTQVTGSARDSTEPDAAGGVQTGLPPHIPGFIRSVRVPPMRLPPGFVAARPPDPDQQESPDRSEAGIR